MKAALAFSVLVLAHSAFATTVYVGSLSGPDSTGTGSTQVTYDELAHTLGIDVQFTDLLSGSTAAHIQCCTAVAGTGTAGIATQTPSLSGFPLGVTSGTYSQVFDLTLTSSFSSTFLSDNGGTAAGAEAALAAGLAAGTAYFNIHTTLFPAGEISGFLVETPEPATFGLIGIPLAGFALWARRKRKS
jgi:hypothetical protein